MTSEQNKSSTKTIIIIASICFTLLVVWKFAALREYAFGLISSEAVVPMPEYGIADAPRIVEAAKADRAGFERQYFRQTLSGEVVFSAAEGRGSSTFLIRMATPGAAPLALTCGMNKFAFAAHKDTVSAFKPGDIVRIKGPIGSDTDGQTIALGDGCTVDPSYSAAR